jgi:hypothetical protein
MIALELAAARGIDQVLDRHHDRPVAQLDRQRGTGSSKGCVGREVAVSSSVRRADEQREDHHARAPRRRGSPARS